MVGPLDPFGSIVETLEEQCARGDSPRAFAPLAEIHRLASRAEEAVRVARAGLELFPDHLGIRLVLARALMDRGERDAASEEYGFVLKRDPGNFEAAAHLGTSVELPGQAPQSDGAPATEPSLSAELEHLADLFAIADEPRGNPPDAIATLTLAEIYARQGLTDRAVEVCEAILSRDPSDQEAASRLEEYRRTLASVE